MDLTRAERNELFQAIEGGDLDPDECDLVEESSTLTVTHRLADTRTYLCVTRHDKYPTLFALRAAIGDIPFEQPPQYHGEWPWLMSEITRWARQAHVMATPDLWAESRLKQQLLSAQGTDENTPFSETERADIAAQLREVKSYVAELHRTGELTAEQAEHVSARLDEAEEASHRIGRKDWRLLFAGLVFTVTATDIITPEVAKHIVVTAMQGLAHVFSDLPPMITY